MNQKNIRVTIDAELCRKARIRAAELDTSLSAVVRDFLVDFAQGDTEAERRKKLQNETLASVRAFRVGKRLTRDETHGRGVR